MLKSNFYRCFCLLLPALFFWQVVAASALFEGAKLRYVANKGQWEAPVLFKAEVPGGAVFAERTCLTYNFCNPSDLEALHHSEHDLHKPFTGTLRGHAYRMVFDGGNAKSVLGAHVLEEYRNYFIGNDKSKWASQVPIYQGLVYQSVFPGIDALVYSDGNNLKYDIQLAPDADVNAIRLRYDGVDGLALREGNLCIKTSIAELIEQKPYAYQTIDGKRVEIACRFTLKGHTVGFEFPSGRRPGFGITIDPTLIFSTFTGSQADNWGYSATFDPNGNLFAAGIAFAQGFPITNGAYQVSYNSGNTYPIDRNIVLVKFNSTGTNLLFGTYLGGSGADNPESMIADVFGNLYLLGTGTSSNFPTTTGSFDQSQNGASDIILLKLNPTGTQLLASTFVGGTADDGLGNMTLAYNYADEFRGELILDDQLNVYVASYSGSLNFPTTPGSYQQNYSGGFQDGVVFKMDSNLSTMLWSTYLGGSDGDGAYGLDIASDYSVFVNGGTYSTNFPTTVGAYQTQHLGERDGFISHISSNGGSLIASTLLGTFAYDQAFFVQLNKNQEVWTMGQTDGPFGTTPGVYANANAGQFLAKFDYTLSNRLVSTTFGKQTGSDHLVPSAFLVDKCNRLFISSWGGQVNTFAPVPNPSNNISGLQTTSNALQNTSDGSDFYLLVLDNNASGLLYATYFGGGISAEHVDGGTSRFDKDGIVYQAICAGCGGFSDLPTTPGAFSQTNNSQVPVSNCNLACFKFKFELTAVTASLQAIPTIATGCAPFSIQFLSTSTSGATLHWDFGDGTTATNIQTATHLFSLPGTYVVSLVATDTTRCNKFDTVRVTVIVTQPFVPYAGPDQTTCPLVPVQLMATAGKSWSWSPTTGLNNPNIQNPTAAPNTTTQYIVTVTDSAGCQGKDTVIVFVQSAPPTQVTADRTKICWGDTVELTATGAISYEWYPSKGLSDSTGASVRAFPDTTTTYIVRGYWGQNSCYSEDSVTIEVTVFPTTGNPDVHVCEPGNVILTAGNALKYRWSTGDTTKSISLNVSRDTMVTVRGYRPPCIGSLDSIAIIFDTVVADFAIDSSWGVAPYTAHFINKTREGSTYTWYFGTKLGTSTQTNPDFTFTEAGRYPVTLYAKSEAGCVDSITKWITLDYVSLYYPNAFTPGNKDSVNDYFIAKSRNLATHKIEIYNRWGERVFESDEIDFAWDGTKNGKAQPMDAYYFHAEAVGLNGQKFDKIGMVALIR